MLEEGVVVHLEEDSMVLVMVLEQSEVREIRECIRTTLMCVREKGIGTAQMQRKCFQFLVFLSPIRVLHLSFPPFLSVSCVLDHQPSIASFDVLLFLCFVL